MRVSYTINKFSDPKFHIINSQQFPSQGINLNLQFQRPIAKDVFQVRFGSGDEAEPNAFLDKSETLSNMVEHLTIDVERSEQEKIITKNKICMIWKKAHEANETKQASFWNRVAVEVFGEPVPVLTQSGGLFRMAGVEAEKRKILARVINPLKNKKDKVNAFLVLHGPPGTGKTLYASCIAEHIGYELVPVNYSDISTNAEGKSIFGEASDRIRKIFENAQKTGRVALFFDEAERFSAHRTGSRVNDAAVTTAEFITSIDKNHEHNDKPENLDKRVLIMAALNRIDNVDTAVYRPVRGYVLNAPPCSEENRGAIFEHEAQKYKISPDFNLESFKQEVIQHGDQFTAADIKALFFGASEYADLDNSNSGQATILSEENIRESLAEVVQVKRISEQGAVNNVS